ncbi:MAG: T9SS type A sorting domain-containing protein, partial [Bacteroidota bacterium]
IGGYYGTYMDGESSDHMTGLVIENNFIEDYYYYAAYFYYQDGMQFNNNKLRNSSSSGSVYGMRAYYADNTTITNNDIAIAGTGTHYGIYFRGDGTSTNPNLIANNVINLTGTGSSTWYGMYIYYNDYSNIYHNTVNLTAGSSTARALYTSSGSDVNIENNIFTNAGGGYAAYISTTSAINTMDHNVYNTTGSNIAYWSGAKATLADLQSANSMDANSIEADPVFTNVSSNDLTPISSAVDNIGTPIPSITTDIFGSPRDPATPDAGAIEFTGISADLALTDGELVNGQCLSANDSVYLTIENPLLTTADFATNNLVANWSVTGPQNSTGSIVINSGTLMPNSTLIIGGDGVDMSAPGDYVLSAWIDPNSDNGFAGNDSLLNYTTHTVNSMLSVIPQYDTIYSPADTIDLSAQSPFFPGGTVFLTEICQYTLTSTGEPTSGKPSYLGDDYVEITGVPNSDLSGYTFEKWSTSGSSPDVTHTFPAGTSFSPSGTYLLSTYQGSTSLANYHQVADVTDGNSSSTNSINIIKDPSGTIVDVVIYGSTSTIPAASGVTTEWTGSGTSGTSSWGIRLEGPDTDDNTNWVKATQDPNVLNAGVTAPAPGSITGFTWSYQGSIVNNNIIDTVVGPFTSNGTYEYVASYNTPCGMVYDTARITVMAPGVTTSMGTIVSCTPGDSVDLVLDFTGTPPWDVQVTNGSDTLWIPNISTTPFTISDTPLVTTNYEALMVNDANGWNYGTANITAEVYNSPVISASISPDPVNYGTPATLDVAVSGSSSYSYSWSPADSLNDPMNYNIKSPMTKNLSNPMTFSVVVTDNATGCSSTADVNVSIVGGPLNAYLSANRDTVCQGDTTQLFSSTTGGSGNYSYNWSSIPSGFNSSNPNPVVTVNGQTTYILTVNDGFNIKTESITIANWNVPSFTLSSINGPTYVECATLDTLAASPSGGMFYGTAVSGNTFYPTAAGTGMHTIYYDYVDPNGCHYLENMTLTVTPDITSPTVNTKNITVPLDANGQASINAGDINDGSTDNCGIAGYAIDQQYFSCADLGANTVTLTAYDNRGNSASNTAQVTIVDNIPPTLSTVNMPVFLDGNGQATISPADVDNGTFDACGLDSIMISQNTFDCQDIGPNLIIFSAMDVNGNSSSTPVVVTVYDNISPVVNTQSTTAYLNAYGLTTISPSDVDNGSTDNCAIMSMSLDNHMFTCSDLGINSVNLTVTDVNMNSASSTAQVNVLDTIAPNVVTKDITVYLDNNGNVGISASDINNGSSDNCGIATMTLSKSSYNCSDLGVNTVTLTASDQSGNTNSSIANVTVLDTISPVITSISDTIVCAGAFNFTAPTATDNCGATVTQTSGPDGGDVLSGGIYTFSYTATDQSGNTAHTSFTVTVSEPDISLGQDISVCHDDTVTLTVTAGYTSYLWSTGEVSNTISLDSLSLGMGTHAIWVTVTDSLGCTATDSINVTFQNCVGIHEFVSEGDISIYPNPTNGLFNLDIQGLKDQNIQICIYNYNGQKVVCEDIESNFQNGYHKTFDLSQQPAGIYLIRLTGSTINKVERIIIQ